jgi:hypothetical protein
LGPAALIYIDGFTDTTLKYTGTYIYTIYISTLTTLVNPFQLLKQFDSKKKTVEAIYTGGDPLPPVIVSKKINSILPERWLVMNDIKLMAFINLEASLWSR